MGRYKRIAIYLLFVGVFSILFGTTYAFFNYTRTGASNELLVGNIYFNHTEGTVITLVDEFPEKKEIARERNDNVIPVTITGYNESEKDIYYKLMISHGDEVSGRTRIDDKFLRFDLVEELANNEERYIVFNESFETINNTILVKDRIDAGTSPSNSVSRTYQLRMWISDDILISDTNEEADYSTSEYENLFASIKITAKGDTENVYYYSSLDDAITAINSESYSSDTTRNLAKVGIYTDSDDNTTNLVFYDDIDTYTYYEINKPVDINLYRYSLNDKSTDTHYTGFDIFSNTSIQNGVINAKVDGDNHEFYIYFKDADVLLNNIELHSEETHVDNEYYTTYFENESSGNLVIKNTNIKNADFYINSANYSAVNIDVEGYIHISENSNLVFNDSSLYGANYSTVYINSNGFMEVNNSKIFADSPACYTNNSTGSLYLCTTAIINSGTLIFNSGYVYGTHSAVQTNNGSKTYVYGGTFESSGTGGLYFTHGANGVAYVENANIGGVSYPAEGKLRPNGVIPTYDGYTRFEARAAFYQGGERTENGESLYLVNCNLYARGGEFIVMRNSTPQQNIYISGTKFLNTRDDQYIRLQNFDGMRLYLGSGNEYGLIDKVYNNGEKVSFDVAREAGAIIDTNVNYKDIVRPE